MVDFGVIGGGGSCPYDHRFGPLYSLLHFVILLFCHLVLPSCLTNAPIHFDLYRGAVYLRCSTVLCTPMYRGSYNKALAWVDVILEFVVERLYFLVPDLPAILGDLAPNLQVRLSERFKRLHGVCVTL